MSKTSTCNLHLIPIQAPAQSCVDQSASLASPASVGTRSDRDCPELIVADDTCCHQRDRRTSISSPLHPASTNIWWPPTRSFCQNYLPQVSGLTALSSATLFSLLPNRPSPLHFRIALRSHPLSCSIPVSTGKTVSFQLCFDPLTNPYHSRLILIWFPPSRKIYRFYKVLGDFKIRKNSSRDRCSYFEH